jgi:hypothetical protein
MRTFAQAWSSRREATLGVRLTPETATIDAGTYFPFFAFPVKQGGPGSIRWSLEQSTTDASVSEAGVFTASRPGRYRIVAADALDPRLRATAGVEVLSAIKETPGEDVDQTHGDLARVHVSDFQVLTVGGWSGTAAMDLVMLWYETATPKVTRPGNLLEARISPLAAALDDKNVLVCGGWTEVKGTVQLLRSAEIFNLPRGASLPVSPPKGAATSTWFAHCGGVIQKLADGSVLLAGGDDGNDRDSGAELFDPKLGTFSILDAKPYPYGASSVSLEDGWVLIFGGSYQNGKEQGPSRDILAFDPKVRAFTRVGSMLAARVVLATVRMPDGKILVSGGCIPATDGTGTVVTARCEIFDPSSGLSTETAPTSEPKAGHAAAMMATGLVVTIGGYAGAGDDPPMCMTIETYNPEQRTWTLFDHPKTGILEPALFQLPGGVMFTGGSRVEFDPAKRSISGVKPLNQRCQ